MLNVIVLDMVSNPYGLKLDELPKEFRLFKYGQNKAYHIGEGSRSIMFDQSDAEYLYGIWKESGLDLAIDYDHQSLDGLSGQKPAAGWIKDFEMREDGLYASVIEWTPRAADMLKNKEYRYFSPSVEMDDMGKMKRLLPVALTNLPALQNIKPLMNNSITTETNIKDNKSTKDKTMSDETLTFSAADMKAKDDELAKALEQINEMKINAALDKAIADKKLAPAKKADFAAVGKKSGIESLELLLSALSVQLPTNVAVEKAETQTETTGEELSSFQKDICIRRGYDMKEFAAKVKANSVQLSQVRGASNGYGHKLPTDQNPGRSLAKKLNSFVGIK